MGQTRVLGLPRNLLIDPHNLFPIKGKFQRWGSWDTDRLDKDGINLSILALVSISHCYAKFLKIVPDSNIINAKITVNRSTQSISHTGKYRFYFISQSVFYALFGMFVLRVLLLRSLGNTSLKFLWCRTSLSLEYDNVLCNFPRQDWMMYCLPTFWLRVRSSSHTHCKTLPHLG